MSADPPKLRNTVVIPLKLEGDYQPPSLPARPIDDDLRVGLLLPTFDSAKSATWNTAVKWKGSTWPPKNVTEIDRVLVNFAEPVAATLPAFVRHLFPKTDVLKNDECLKCDLLIAVDMQSVIFDAENGNMAGVTVTAVVKARASDGTPVTSFSAVGLGRTTKLIYWSEHTRARAIGMPALQEVMDDIVVKLVNNPSLRTFVKEKAAQRARPSDLETIAAFDDANSILPNGRLDAGERAHLHFTIRNHGAGPAFGVRLRLGMTVRGVTMPTETEVGDIPPGGKKETDISLSAGLEVETAQQQLRVETTEKRDYGGRPVVLQLATERLERPTLEIADVRLDDRGGRSVGDGDGRPSNGETIETVILVRNSGPGEAVGAALTVSATPGIEVVEPAVNIGAIPVNAVKEVRALLRIPITFNSSYLGLMLQAVETRGPTVATVKRDQQWAISMKRPRVQVGFRLFDGNSPQSRGNRDGIANNGETIEVALLPTNSGRLAARGVRLALSSPIAGLEVKPTSIEIGELPPLAEGAEHRVQVTVPRALGRDEPLQSLPLNISFAQTDFSVSEQTIRLPFNVQTPQLVAAVAGQPALPEGKEALFALDVRNQGSLAAEDVRIDVSCDNPGIELLDAAGAPARTIRIDVGSIPAEAANSRIQLKARVRRNVSTTAATLKATVSQRDFASAGAQTSVRIIKEEPSLISTIPLTVAAPTVARSAGVPATISFQRYRDGSLLPDETVTLTFEVQSQTTLELVRLEQNRRSLELPEVTPILGGGTYLRQYETQVHLEYGANEFEVVVVTSQGVRSSRSITLHREKPRGRIWLAVVGVSSYYDSSITRLRFATEDAIAIHDYYRQLGVPGDQVIELLDKDATLANIKRSLGSELVKRAINPDDTVLIYFAGHGGMEADPSSADSDGYSKYLLPNDANPADLFSSALSMEELSRILQRMRAERVVLILDSCFSGAAGGRTPFEPNAQSRGVITEEFLARMANSGKGRVILTASGSREVAQESIERRHGLFTSFLLEGLQGGADEDHDGRIDVDEIYKYVSRNVSLATHGRQNPTRKSPNLTGTVILGGRLQ